MKWLNYVELNSIDQLIDETVPKNIRLKNKLKLDEPLSEYEFIKRIKLFSIKKIKFIKAISEWDIIQQYFHQ